MPQLDRFTIFVIRLMSCSILSLGRNTIFNIPYLHELLETDTQIYIFCLIVLRYSIFGSWMKLSVGFRYRRSLPGGGVFVLNIKYQLVFRSLFPPLFLSLTLFRLSLPHTNSYAARVTKLADLWSVFQLLLDRNTIFNMLRPVLDVQPKAMHSQTMSTPYRVYDICAGIAKHMPARFFSWVFSSFFCVPKRRALLCFNWFWRCVCGC